MPDWSGLRVGNRLKCADGLGHSMPATNQHPTHAPGSVQPLTCMRRHTPPQARQALLASLSQCIMHVQVSQQTRWRPSQAVTLPGTLSPEADSSVQLHLPLLYFSISFSYLHGAGGGAHVEERCTHDQPGSAPQQCPPPPPKPPSCAFCGLPARSAPLLVRLSLLHVRLLLLVAELAPLGACRVWAAGMAATGMESLLLISSDPSRGPSRAHRSSQRSVQGRPSLRTHPSPCRSRQGPSQRGRP
jgi:hypothetical protein